LPSPDNYGTQKVISFLRQLTEQNGFYRPSDKCWVNLERIQFVGACNPPTDQGRHPMTDRFMRHYPLILVDFPGEESLKQIYSTFNRAMLKTLPDLSGFAEPLTEAMVEFYMESQNHFTADMQPHYVYSPRELTRWKLAIYEALPGLDCLEDLVRLYCHEALRLFEDRLVTPEEKEWCNENIDLIASKWFPSANLEKALARPILFSEYLHKMYKSVSQDDLRKFIQGKLYTFNEEELDVPLVVFDSVVDHILRIDRVLKQPLGHLLLVGSSGVGKTTLARFVAWINNQTVFQIKAGKNYQLENFDEDIRSVMRRSGVKGEKICFIFDESNVLSSAFLERMNALLASGEVPGLFEGDEYTHLMNQCRESTQIDGKMIDSEEELYKTFVREVQRNLHVVFTMNPANPDFSNRTASSPALFNR
jgi:dynein heavy chain 1